MALALGPNILLIGSPGSGKTMLSRHLPRRLRELRSIRAGDHPIVPIMLYDAVLARTMASRLLEQGIYVIGFSYPVVPKDQARIRVQVSAAHTREHLDKAVEAFTRVAIELNVLSHTHSGTRF